MLVSSRLAVLASGQGTILEAILAADIEPAVVLADRACRALTVAEGALVPGALVERESFGPRFDRAGYTARVVDTLESYKVDTVAMAGFMTVLTEAMFDTYGGRILNTHPSLLPAFPGAHAVADALAAGVAITGCTVHLATLQVDHGPVLAQEAVAIEPGDTVESLHERIKAVERRLYPAVIKEFCA
jgi:phosphoribosylglycinamide formyltransferase 1